MDPNDLAPQGRVSIVLVLRRRPRGLGAFSVGMSSRSSERLSGTEAGFLRVRFLDSSRAPGQNTISTTTTTTRTERSPEEVAGN
jgi:hypothetical protein